MSNEERKVDDSQGKRKKKNKEEKITLIKDSPINNESNLNYNNSSENIVNSQRGDKSNSNHTILNEQLNLIKSFNSRLGLDRSFKDNNSTLKNFSFKNSSKRNTFARQKSKNKNSPSVSHVGTKIDNTSSIIDSKCSQQINNGSIQNNSLINKESQKSQKSIKSQNNEEESSNSSDKSSKSKNKEKNSNENNNMTDSNPDEEKKNQTNSNIPKKIKWSTKKKKDVIDKLKAIEKKVKEKAKVDHDDIVQGIRENQDHAVLQTLAHKEFIDFYRNEDNLFKSDEFMDIMIKHLKFGLLMKVIEQSNKAYVFDTDYIFKCILYLIHPKVNKVKDGGFHRGRHIEILEKNKSYFDNLKSNNLNEDLGKYIGDPPSNFSKIRDKRVSEIISNIVDFKLYDQDNPEKIQIISWCLAMLGFSKLTRLVIFQDNSELFEKELNEYNHFKTDEDILSYARSKEIYLKTIENCLQCKFEQLAIILGNFTKTHITDLIGSYEKAAQNEDMLFLQFIWEKGYCAKNKKSNKVKKLAENEEAGNNENNGNNNINTNTNKEQEKVPGKVSPKEFIETIIKILKQNVDNNHSSDDKIKKIFTWTNIDKASVLYSLFDYNCFEHICYLLTQWPKELFVNAQFFRKSLEKKQKELILFYLPKDISREILFEKQTQELIINEYIPNGEYFYYGAECLSYIYKNKWHSDLTGDLCRNITKTIKTKDILNCHSPLLTCLLLVEFLKKIKLLSISDIINCEKVSKLLLDFCQGVQESIHNENAMAYLMGQKNTKDKNVFQLASDNELYQLLETPEIGTIIKKSWDGTLNSNGLKNSSSLSRFLFNIDDKIDPFNAFESLDPSKSYFFQLTVRLDGCSSRINEMGLFSIFLVIVYNLYIYLLNDKDEILNTYNKTSSEAQFFFYLYLILVHLLIGNIFVEFLFFFVSGREIRLEVWNYVDVVLYIFAWLICLDTKKFTGEYNDDNIGESTKDLIWSIQVPVLNKLGIEDSSFSTQVSFWIKIMILSINDFIVWTRVTGVLLTYRDMGPVIRMVFTMGSLLLKYIFIIILFMACCAGIFTCIFNRHSSQFIDFSTSVISLFGAFLNTFNCYDFDSNYQVIGSIILLVYVCISSVLFINLLIAIISNGFQKINKVVESSHRAVLIRYCNKYKWDEKYGYLILLSPPYNLLGIPIYIINVIISKFSKSYSLPNSEEQESFNKYATRLLYTVCYFPIVIIIFILYTICLIPFVYIKGLMCMIFYVSSIKIQKGFKLFYILKWLLFGFFFVFYIFFKDIYLCFLHLFTKIEQKGDEIIRIMNNLSEQDVATFLKFIHSPQAKEASSDVHSMFMAYIDFQNEDSKLDKAPTINQINAIKQKRASTIKKTETKLNQDVPKGSINEIYRIDMAKKVRKNLMVIETLENFVVDDDNIETSYVNIDKMRKMLPLAINITKSHFSRLLYSNVSILGGMNKIKLNKVNYRRYLLTKQIIDTAKGLDRQIDIEISKIQRKSVENEKNNSKKKEENARHSVFFGDITPSQNFDKKEKKNEEKFNNINDSKSLYSFYQLIEKIKTQNKGIINKKKEDIVSEEVKENSDDKQTIKEIGEAEENGDNNSSVNSNYKNELTASLNNNYNNQE